MKALTGSMLRSGEVVYWAGDDRWTPALIEARLMDDAEADAALARAKKQETVVVGVYLIGMEDPGRPAAREAVRETIRARGPTTHPHFGKQAGPAT